MKKLTIIPLAAMICGAAYGQGELTFENGSAAKVGIQNPAGSASVFPTKTSVPGVEIALFYQADPTGSAAPATFSFAPGNTALGNWTFFGTTTLSAAGGIFLGPNIDLAGITGGANAWIEIVAWNNSATTFAQALATSTLGGNSVAFSVATIDPTINPKPQDNLLTSNPAFTGVTMTPLVPEPTTLALGALGAASLLAFRRKK